MVNHMIIFDWNVYMYILGHTSRILSLIMGPKGNPIVSLSADETIRFWNGFPIDVQRKKKLEMTRTHSYPTKLNFNCR
jgi:WD40 repeat protein